MARQQWLLGSCPGPKPLVSALVAPLIPEIDRTPSSPSSLRAPETLSVLTELRPVDCCGICVRWYSFGHTKTASPLFLGFWSGCPPRPEVLKMKVTKKWLINDSKWLKMSVLSHLGPTPQSLFWASFSSLRFFGFSGILGGHPLHNSWLVCLPVFRRFCLSCLSYLQFRSQKGHIKPTNRMNSTKEFSEQFEGLTGSLPTKTRILRQIAPESSPEPSAKSLSRSFSAAPFLSPISFQCFSFSVSLPSRRVILVLVPSSFVQMVNAVRKSLPNRPSFVRFQRTPVLSPLDHLNYKLFCQRKKERHGWGEAFYFAGEERTGNIAVGRDSWIPFFLPNSGHSP